MSQVISALSKENYKIDKIRFEYTNDLYWDSNTIDIEKEDSKLLDFLDSYSVNDGFLHVSVRDEEDVLEFSYSVDDKDWRLYGMKINGKKLDYDSESFEHFLVRGRKPVIYEISRFQRFGVKGYELSTPDEITT